MKLHKIIAKLQTSFLSGKTQGPRTKNAKLHINHIDEDVEVATIDKIGITESGQGAVLLKTNGGTEFPISAFSAETAKIISGFQQERFDELPSVYGIIEQICENTELLLVKVRIYPSGHALRANLYFSGKTDFVLRNYRASDAIALAAFYSVPILIKKDLLQKFQKTKS